MKLDVRPTAETDGEVITGAPQAPWIQRIQSESEPRVDSAFLEHAKKRTRSHNGAGASERLATLGMLLAQLEDVSFEDVAVFVGVNASNLEKMMHGELTIARRHLDRWTSLIEVLANLRMVLNSSATSRWLKTPTTKLNDLTPLMAVKKGRVDDVLRVTQSYLDPSFS